jgi:hypothetical protein
LGQSRDKVGTKSGQSWDKVGTKPGQSRTKSDKAGTKPNKAGTKPNNAGTKPNKAGNEQSRDKIAGWSRMETEAVTLEKPQNTTKSQKAKKAKLA